MFRTLHPGMRNGAQSDSIPGESRPPSDLSSPCLPTLSAPLAHRSGADIRGTCSRMEQSQHHDTFGEMLGFERAARPALLTRQKESTRNAYLMYEPAAIEHAGAEQGNFCKPFGMAMLKGLPRRTDMR